MERRIEVEFVSVFFKGAREAPEQKQMTRVECRLLYVMLQGALARLYRRIARLQRRRVPLHHIFLARLAAASIGNANWKCSGHC